MTDLVSASEANRRLEAFPANSMRFEARLARTVQVQAGQMEAVKALHSGDHWCTGAFVSHGWWESDETCPTARALGVEA